MSAETVRIQLEPSGTVVDVPRGTSLSSPLSLHGIEFPCGSTGLCGGCRVRVLQGSLPVTQQDGLFFTAEDLASGWRLACQAIADVPLVLECEQWHMEILSDNSALSGRGKQGLGIAVDLGTTTLAAQIIDLATGNILGVETELNPQASFGSDVMSRIRAALSGADLTTLVRASIASMIERLARRRKHEIAEVVLVGNSVMHHLFSNLDVEPLSHAPFYSPNLGEQRFSAAELGWSLSPACRISFARCLGAFVGSDILAGMIAVGMPSSKEMIALVDLGTNGEIAIGNRDRILYASTAAGPAFEAASIRMGMRASSGAISRVSHSSREVHVIVIGDQEPRGICGSGLVDAVAVGLETGAILSSGRIANGTKLFPVAGPVVLHQADIRELQLCQSRHRRRVQVTVAISWHAARRTSTHSSCRCIRQLCAGFECNRYRPAGVFSAADHTLRQYRPARSQDVATLLDPTCITQDGTCGVGRRRGFSGRICELHEFPDSPAACLIAQQRFPSSISSVEFVHCI